MKTMRLFPLELKRLLQSRLTWLMMALAVLSPALGLVLYKPATSTTMLSMYLANPAIAGGVAGAILFGLLTIFELDRACRSRVDILTDAVVSPLTTALTRLLALLTAAVLTVGLTMLVWLPISVGCELCAGLFAAHGAGAAPGHPGGGRSLPVHPPGGSVHRPVYRLLRPEPDGVGSGMAVMLAQPLRVGFVR